MFFDFSKLSVLLISVLVLASCGGGGGGQSAQATSSATTSSAISSATSSANSSSSSVISSSSSSISNSSSSLAFSTSQSSSSQSSEIASSLGSSSAASTKTYPNKIAATMWVGESDTLVQFAPEAEGLEFVRSLTDCDFTRINTCLLGQSDVVAGDTIKDTAFKLGGSAYYALRNGNLEAKRYLNTSVPGERTGAATFLFNGKLWLIGGYLSGSGVNNLNDIWSSTDGTAWFREKEHAEFPPVKDHQIISFKNEVWLIGGTINDIWSSADGITWVKRKEAATFASRTGHQLSVFNNKLWLVGGFGSNFLFLNDVWSSEDGVNWIKQLDSAPFSKRDGHQLAVFKNKLWLIGGYEGFESYKNDVWFSDDGINWEKSSVPSPFASRDLHSLAVINNSLWLSGGFHDEFLNDIWTSDDGLNWRLLTPNSYFPSSAYANLYQLKGSVFLSNSMRGEVWSSSDAGVNWSKKASGVDLPSRTVKEAPNGPIVSFDNKLFITNGENTVWSSVDGIKWNGLPMKSSLPRRSNFSLIEHNNRLWLIGGFVQVPQYKNDVWSSSDGIEWRLETSAANFEPRASATAISFNNKLWVIGGNDYYKYYNDIWSSSDGITWDKVGMSSLPSGGLVTTSLKIFNNKLWFVIVSGNIFTTDRTVKVLSSADGSNWTDESVTGGLVVENNFDMEVFNGRLWIVNAGSAVKSLWSSADGINWVSESNNIAFTSGQLIALNGQLMVLASKSYSSNVIWASPDAKNWRMGYQDVFVFGPSQ